MSNLLNSPAGISALRAAVRECVEQRIARWFERNTVIGFDAWVLAGKPALTANDALGVVDALNASHDKEILDLFDLLGQIDETNGSIDIDYHVNTVTGDDENGDGSLTHPFRSIPRAQRLLPDLINSKINIFISAPISNPALTMSDIVARFGDQGQLTIQGVDPPEIESGPYVTNTVTQVGISTAFAHAISPLVPPAWPANSKVGYFIHLLSGLNAGVMLAIAENDANTLYVANSNYLPAPGDSFEIVRPGTKIDLGATTNPNFNLTYKYDVLSITARFALSNLDFINFSTIEISGQDINITNSFLSCFLILFIGYSMEINHYSLFDDSQLVNAPLRLIHCPNVFVVLIEIDMQRNLIWYLTAQDVFGFATNVFLLDSACQSCSIYDGIQFYIDRVFFRTSVADTIYSVYGTPLIEIGPFGIWVQACVNVINVPRGEIIAGRIEGNAANVTGYTVLVGGIVKMTFDGTPISGVTGDIQWLSTGAASAFPVVAGTSVNDGNGAYVVKMT
jgi:hypothetical protein